jgi:hypothetical protein
LDQVRPKTPQGWRLPDALSPISLVQTDVAVAAELADLGWSFPVAHATSARKQALVRIDLNIASLLEPSDSREPV